MPARKSMPNPMHKSMHKPRHKTPLGLALLAGLALLPAAVAAPAHAGADTYLALGDSYAYGVTTYANVDNPALGMNNYFGLQGYVQPFAAFLGAQQTINLAIPGETTTSFTTGSNDFADANFNYVQQRDGLTLADSQATALGKTLAYETAHGHTISDVTVQLGGNDLLGAVFNNPAFLTDSPLAKAIFINAQLTALGANYGALLHSLSVTPALTGAQVYVIGYFDPFADLGASDPFGLDPLGNQLSGDFVQTLNATLAADATAAGFHFVDPYAAFHNYPGDHSALSYIHSPLGDPNHPSDAPNFHPTPLGYGLLAQQIEAAAAPVPEASTTVSFGLLLALGMGGVMVAKRKKQSA